MHTQIHTATHIVSEKKMNAHTCMRQHMPQSATKKW